MFRLSKLLFVLVLAPSLGWAAAGVGGDPPATCTAGDTWHKASTPRQWFDCSATNTWVPVGQSILGVVKSVNLDNAGSDNAVTISKSSTGSYIVRKVIVTNTSTSLGASSATLGVFTAAAGGGTTVVTAATLTALTGATKFTDMTIALTADTLTSATLYVRNVAAHGGAATVDVYIIGDLLP